MHSVSEIFVDDSAICILGVLFLCVVIFCVCMIALIFLELTVRTITAPTGCWEDVQAYYQPRWVFNYCLCLWVFDTYRKHKCGSQTPQCKLWLLIFREIYFFSYLVSSYDRHCHGSPLTLLSWDEDYLSLLFPFGISALFRTLLGSCLSADSDSSLTCHALTIHPKRMLRSQDLANTLRTVKALMLPYLSGVWVLLNLENLINLEFLFFLMDFKMTLKSHALKSDSIHSFGFK